MGILDFRLVFLANNNTLAITPPIIKDIIKPMMAKRQPSNNPINIPKITSPLPTHFSLENNTNAKKNTPEKNAPVNACWIKLLPEIKVIMIATIMPGIIILFGIVKYL